MKRLPRKTTETRRLPDGTALVEVTGGAFARVDAVDLDEVMSVMWGLSHGYAKAKVWLSLSSRRRFIGMHRLIAMRMGIADEAPSIDHIDGDRLNNTRANLRAVDQFANQQNRQSAQRGSLTGQKGVLFHRGRCVKRYDPVIRINGKLVHLGMCHTLDEAIAKRRDAELLYYPSGPEARQARALAAESRLAEKEKP